MYFVFTFSQYTAPTSLVLTLHVLCTGTSTVLSLYSYLLCTYSLHVLTTGDLAATSVGGRAVACILEIIGVLGLAIPVGVIGSELDRAYTKHFVRYIKVEKTLIHDMRNFLRLFFLLLYSLSLSLSALLR